MVVGSGFYHFFYVVISSCGLIAVMGAFETLFDSGCYFLLVEGLFA